MTDYKPGDKVVWFPNKMEKATAFIREGPFLGVDKNYCYVISESANGVCFWVSEDRISAATPEPEWEYLLSGPTFYGWANIPLTSQSWPPEYRRLKDDHTTVEHLTPEQVEDLRNDRS